MSDHIERVEDGIERFRGHLNRDMYDRLSWEAIAQAYRAGWLDRTVLDARRAVGDLMSREREEAPSGADNE